MPAETFDSMKPELTNELISEEPNHGSGYRLGEDGLNILERIEGSWCQKSIRQNIIRYKNNENINEKILNLAKIDSNWYNQVLKSINKLGLSCA